MSYLILDVASAQLPNAADFIDFESIEAPDNYKKPEAIAGYIEAEKKRRIEKAGLDLDLAWITGIGMVEINYPPDASDLDAVRLCQSEEQEREVVKWAAYWFKALDPRSIITYNGTQFDLAILQRRARYLGVDFPRIVLSPRWKCPCVDLMDLLIEGDPSRRRSLGFYVRRMGWTDLVKPLTGAEESRVPETGQWDLLEQSIRHDLVATKRLAQWLGVVEA